MSLKLVVLFYAFCFIDIDAINSNNDAAISILKYLDVPNEIRASLENESGSEEDTDSDETLKNISKNNCEDDDEADIETLIKDFGDADSDEIPPKSEPDSEEDPWDSDTDNNGTIKCGDNERLDKCPSNCSSEICPTSEGQAKVCLKPEKCLKPACKCKFNYSRGKDNKCIPTRQCPPFECSRPNEEYNSCPPLCPTDSCSQASPSGKCPPFGAIGLVLQCQPSCRCVKDYWRNDKNVCIPYNQCPNVIERRRN